VRSTQPHRIFGYCLKNRVKIERRAADNVEYV
jgi:hypothetical protein